MVSPRSNKDDKKFTTIRITVEAYNRLIKLAVRGETFDKIIDKLVLERNN